MVKPVFQFKSLVESMMTLTNEFDKQMCQFCCIERAERYTALCRGCHGEIEVQKPKLDQVDEECCICHTENEDKTVTDSCSICGRMYHLKCHFPEISEDV